MAYHVEVRRSRNHARVFNIDDEELRHTVLDPWTAGGPLRLGDQVWEKEGAELRILEGPELSTVDLQYGKGWSRAEHTAQDVTAAVLAAAMEVTATGVVVLAANDRAGANAADRLKSLGFQPAEWAPVREWIVERATGSEQVAHPGVAAVLLVCDGELASWLLFDAGLAIGALGPRAILTAADDWPVPPELADFDLFGPATASGDPLAERLEWASHASVGLR